jgi:uncharacterized cupin superfamily protein
MADYTHKNLKDDVDNMAEKYGLAPDLEARFARSALGLEGGGFSYQRYAPNFRSPSSHRHERQEEVYVVVGGGGRIKIGDEIRELRTWDAVRVAADTPRGLEAGPEGLEVIAIGFGEGGDAEMIENFWSE